MFVKTLILSLICCGALSAFTATVGAYPGSDSSVKGSLTVTQTSGGKKTTFAWNVSGLSTKCTCTGAACDAAGNGCGIHFHVGKSCATAADVGGHLYGNGVTVDPWTGANGAHYTYSATNKGLSTLATSYGSDLKASVGRAVVLHNELGGRIGCGVLAESSASII